MIPYIHPKIALYDGIPEEENAAQDPREYNKYINNNISAGARQVLKSQHTQSAYPRERLGSSAGFHKKKNIYTSGIRNLTV